MNFGNYNLNPYGISDSYRYQKNKDLYAPKKQNESQDYNGFSLDDVVGSDCNRLLDLAVTAAFGIVYRLKIYRESTTSLEQKWNEISKDIGALGAIPTGYSMNIERKRSMLLKEKNLVEMSMLENKHEAWKDMNDPVTNFVTLFHRYKETVSDHKYLMNEDTKDAPRPLPY